MAVALALLLVGCSGAVEDTTTSRPSSTSTADMATTTTTGPVADTTAKDPAPTDLRVAVIFVSPADDTWSTSMLDALSRAQEAKPHGLDITFEWFENIAYADGERVIRDLAASAKYDLIIGHSAYSDAVAAVKDEFPEIAFVFTGSGNEPTGGNGYWLDVNGYEAAYLAGIAAGLLNETDMIGAVAAYPFPNVVGPVNAFFDGAISVKPSLETEVIYIESWFDPTKALEAGSALAKAGADSLYAASAFGTFQAASDAERVFAIGDLNDQEELAPDVVITSVMVLWDPSLSTVIDAWWTHQVSGAPYDAPTERIQFLMPEGGSDIAPLNAAIVPPEVIDAVMDARDQILSGELVVPYKPEPVE